MTATNKDQMDNLKRLLSHMGYDVVDLGNQLGIDPELLMQTLSGEEVSKLIDTAQGADRQEDGTDQPFWKTVRNIREERQRKTAGQKDITNTSPQEQKPSENKAVAKANESLRNEKKMAVVKGSEMALALQLGLPPETANMFFMQLGDQMYIKVAGLLYMAKKKQGYQNIEISDSFDVGTSTWVAVAKIYPPIKIPTIEAISKIQNNENQKELIDSITSPTNGIGTASKVNVQNMRMHPFLREMAQTRALGRALRSYTGYGGTTYEEMPDGSTEVD